MNPIVYRSSFQDLQVGDVFLVRIGGWDSTNEPRKVTRLTAERFYYLLREGCEVAYRRKDGRKVGANSYSEDAILATPELIEQAEKESAVRKLRYEVMKALDKAGHYRSWSAERQNAVLLALKTTEPLDLSVPKT